MLSAGYLCHIVMNVEFSRSVFGKIRYQISTLMKILLVGAGWLLADGRRKDRRTDRYYESHSGFSKFFERAKIICSQSKVFLLKFQPMRFVCLEHQSDWNKNTVKINMSCNKQNDNDENFVRDLCVCVCVCVC